MKVRVGLARAQAQRAAALICIGLGALSALAEPDPPYSAASFARKPPDWRCQRLA